MEQTVGSAALCTLLQLAVGAGGDVCQLYCGVQCTEGDRGTQKLKGRGSERGSFKESKMTLLGSPVSVTFTHILAVLVFLLRCFTCFPSEGRESQVLCSIMNLQLKRIFKRYSTLVSFSMLCYG